MLTSSWINLFLLFVPLGFASEYLHWPAVWRFSLNFLAIVPLAKVSDDGWAISSEAIYQLLNAHFLSMQLLGDCTEQSSLKLGQTLGGLLNAT
jgi:Ca2+:H+ antiporter